jgi:hypothetical protein
VKIFDLSNFLFNSDFNPQNRGQQLPEKVTELLPVEKRPVLKGSVHTGKLIDSSDSDLIRNHLEQYLPTDSLRLEIQMERVTKDLGKTQKELNALSLLPDSESKLNQQKILLEKRRKSVELLNRYKNEYKQISPLHRFALWFKEKLKGPNTIPDKFVTFMYGNQGALLSNLKSANQSLNLLYDQARQAKRSSSTEEGTHNMLAILKEFEKIENNIQGVQNNFAARKGPDLFMEGKKLFQRTYYGYELPNSFAKEE